MSADGFGGRNPDDLTIPFIFVPHGEPESPDVAAFKARYPDWFSIPASFIPHPRAPEPAAPTLARRFETESPLRRRCPPPPRPESGTDWDGTVRAFLAANAVLDNPVAVLRGSGGADRTRRFSLVPDGDMPASDAAPSGIQVFARHFPSRIFTRAPAAWRE